MTIMREDRTASGLRLYPRHILSQAIYAALAAVPAVCFTGALLTDIAYVNSPDMQWTNFSAWLLAFGMLFAGLAFLAGIVRAVQWRPRPVTASDWLYAACAIAAMALALLNNFVHSRDAWTSVWPEGLMLSVATVFMMCLAAYFSHRSNQARHLEYAQ